MYAHVNSLFEIIVNWQAQEIGERGEGQVHRIVKSDPRRH